MSYLNFIEVLLNLQGVILKGYEINEKDDLVLHIEMQKKTQVCPCCGNHTRYVHDYREQHVKDIPGYHRSTTFCLNKRRYVCKECGKKFQEKNPFLPKYYRMTSRLITHVIDDLRDVSSFTSVAKKYNISVPTVIRIFDLVGYPRPLKMPNVLAIDEFKGNTGGQKYNCIVTDPETKIVLDILPKRYGTYISGYFREIDKEERLKVKYFVSDMYSTYQTEAACWFRNSKRIIDKYHWERQVIWAFESVRKQEQCKFSKQYRIYFKHSKKLLLKRYKYLTDDEKTQVNVMLETSPTLASAYFYKEKFLEIHDATNFEESKEMFRHWIDSTESCSVPQLRSCSNTFRNWYTEILNSLEYGYTNGFTEGCNNKIKILKRNAYGYKNFERFRNRILHMYSHQRERLA